MTLRFRKWSRKAYAAFASLGRCVTIGCLSKSVADSSLKKQKAGAAAGDKNGSFVETNDGKDRETGTGVPDGCGNRLGTVLEIFGLGVPQAVLCPVNAAQSEDNYILNGHRTRMTRTMQSQYTVFALSASFVFLNEGDKGDKVVRGVKADTLANDRGKS